MARSKKVGRVAAFTALWRAVRGASSPGAPAIGTRVRAVPKMVALTLTGRYPLLGYGRLAGMALAVAYLVSPVDLVPELVLPLIGVGDDALVLAWLAGTVLSEADRFLVWEGTASAAGPAPAADAGDLGGSHRDGYSRVDDGYSASGTPRTVRGVVVR